MAVGIAVVLPMINTYGIAVTNALCAVLVWISFGYVRRAPFAFFFSCHPDIDVVYQDPLLYHPVWGSYESVLRRWFFDRRN